MTYTTCAGWSQPGPITCNLKNYTGTEYCKTCSDAKHAHFMTNTSPTDPSYPRSSKPVFGQRGAARRLAEQPGPRACGTGDGQVANTPATTSPQRASVVTDVGPMAPDLMDPLP